jgi:ABC-2 type transport system ATP-binding protein
VLDARAFHPKRTAREHLAVVCAGARIPRARIARVLEEVGLSAVADHPPSSFSLGMVQRLGLAVALLGEPDTLVLDEPANGLDPHGVRWLRDFLRGYVADGNAVLMSSHILSEMELVADHLVVISRGRLVADAPLHDFIRSAGLATVVVRVSRPQRLARELRRAGASAECLPDGLLSVRGVEQRQVAEAAARCSCVVYELFTRTGSLEDSFLKLSEPSLGQDLPEGAVPSGGRAS